MILHQFVIADVSTNSNIVKYYDERGQGKGGDAVCSLRIGYHINKFQQESPPKHSISVRDNCVGQNKSNDTMKFDAFLSLCFYESVTSIYLKAGHSHMKPDVVVAWTRNALSGLNVYTPQDIIDIVNKVISITAEFLDHNSPSRPFFINWGAFLDKYLSDLPAGFTSYYFFEFRNGTVSARRLANTPDEDAWTVSLCNNPEQTKKAMLKELFGSHKKDHILLSNILLPKHPGITLKPRKLRSLANKYDTIPPNKLAYYPAVEILEGDDSSVESDEDNLTAAQIVEQAQRKIAKKSAKKPKSANVLPKNPVGRPKLSRPVPPGSMSILKFLSPVKSSKAADRQAPAEENKEDPTQQP